MVSKYYRKNKIKNQITNLYQICINYLVMDINIKCINIQDLNTIDSISNKKYMKAIRIINCISYKFLQRYNLNVWNRILYSI